MYFLARLEETGVSIWIRETGWLFFGSLIAHSLALALVAGIGIAACLSTLGVTPGVTSGQLRGFRFLLGLGVLVVVMSGLLLLFAYPAKALTNWVFYLKLGAVILGLSATSALLADTPDNKRPPHWYGSPAALGAMTLLCWLTSITAGRFLAYTHQILLASSFY